MLADHPSVLVVEDDHAGPVAGTPVATLARHQGPWATVRSVSKWLGPDFRAAVLAGDERTVDLVEGHQALGPGWVSWHAQETVAAMWDDPATMSLVRHATLTYARRRQALAAAWRLPQQAGPVGRSGLTAWVDVPDETVVTAALLAEGWAVTPGARFRTGGSPAIRVGLATVQTEEAERLALAVEWAVRRAPVRVG